MYAADGSQRRAIAHGRATAHGRAIAHRATAHGSESRATAAALLLVAAVLAVLPGCNILGPAYYFVHGPDRIPRLFTLPKERPTVFFLDDRASVLPDRAVRREIAAVAQQHLLDEEALVDVISFDSALNATGGDSFSRPMSIVEIGRAVGAEIVVYATMDAFTLSADGITYEPTASARVKVIDVTAGERLFPTGMQESHTVAVTLSRRQGAAPTTSGERRAAERDLGEQLGVALADVFIDHHPPDDSRVTGTGRE